MVTCLQSVVSKASLLAAVNCQNALICLKQFRKFFRNNTPNPHSLRMPWASGLAQYQRVMDPLFSTNGNVFMDCTVPVSG